MPPTIALSISPDTASADFEARVREAMASEPPDHAQLHALGLEAGLAGKAEDALELLSLAAELSPTHAVYHLSIGRLLSVETMFNQAALAYLRAQELAPSDVTILTELATVLEQIHKHEEASAVRDRIAELTSTQKLPSAKAP